MVEYKGKKVIVMCCSCCNLNCEHCYISYKGNRTPEDLLNDVCLTALRKFKDKDIEEQEGLDYLKKTLYTESIFQYNRIKNEIVIFTDEIPEKGYNQNFDI